MLRPLLVCFCALALVAEAYAQEAPPVSLTGTHQHDLVSTVNGQAYRLYVAPPRDYAAGDTTYYPVLYVLDGHLSFPAAVSARASMEIFGELEDVIIVGISDGDFVFDSWFTNRWRDYTPSANPAADSSAARNFDQPVEAVQSGGGPGFLEVLRQEVIPFIEGTYTTSGDRGLSGHSFGGLFATYVLFAAPDLFQRYGINSPSLWWNDGETFAAEAAFAETHEALPAHVFLSVGSEEGRTMVPPLERLGDTLRSRGYEGLTVDAVVFQDETHTSVVPAMMARTLRVLYTPRDRAQ